MTAHTPNSSFLSAKTGYATSPRPSPNRKPVLPSVWRRVLMALIALGGLALLVSALDSPVMEQITGTVHIDQDIGKDTTWHANRTYVLETDVFVHGGARLTIEPGTRILGEHGSSLIVARESQLIARGTRSAPIVFTSAQDVGERARGDWGGVVLLGEDRTNEAFARVEGVDGRDIRGHFGGQVEEGSCGELTFVRIEYAGYEAFPGNELNGLTLGGCGPDTVLEHIQVHKALDDGIEFFGGSASMRHVLITGARDDSLDWDLGWNGRVQHLIIQQHTGEGDRGFEGDNSPERDDARPRSTPEFSNVTLISNSGEHTAMVLRSGTAGRFGNILIAGYGTHPIDLRDPLTGSLLEHNQLAFDSLLIESSRSIEQIWPAETGEKNNDAGVDEATVFAAPTQTAEKLFTQNARNPRQPVFRPGMQAYREQASWPSDSDFWDRSATYYGAVDPQVSNPWYLGWTDFSEN
ncbi:hypothetical protein [Saccharospirillum salsuginis]|nr:hypothetical protein [Saccharospirillum salsuginis]